MKQMVLDFFDADRLIYTKMVKKGQYVNATFNMDTLAAFLTIFKQKRLQMVEQGLDFNWDKSPIHTAAIGLKLPVQPEDLGDQK